MMKLLRSSFVASELVQVNTSACDGCGTCVQVCPFGVFEMVSIGEEEFKTLSLLRKIKVRLRGNTKSFVVMPQACIGCGRCATLCHQRAITVQKIKGAF